MAPKKQTVTAKALQSLLTRIGSASSGTKATLQDRLARDIYKPRLFERRVDWKARQELDWGRKLRIVSIDMGIKNLAFCDVEVDYPSKDSLNATLNVIRWEKIDLVKSTRSFRHHLPSPKKIKKGSIDEDEDVDPYSLKVLSRTAHSLIKRDILSGAPDIILIEKQRWRSGGGSAILQWTVRVNTLEAMLWAILQTLRSEWEIALEGYRKPGKRNYDVCEVDPKRVGQYWLGQTNQAQESSLLDENDVDEKDQGATKKKTSRGKAEKKAKIAILRSWLSPDNPSTEPSARGNTPTITFDIIRAGHIKQALCSPSKSPRRKPKKSSDIPGGSETAAEEPDDTGADLKKLDDITDCFLQAAAWVSWESNRLQLLAVQDKMRKEDGSVAKMSEEVVLEMAKEVGVL